MSETASKKIAEAMASELASSILGVKPMASERRELLAAVPDVMRIVEFQRAAAKVFRAVGAKGEPLAKLSDDLADAMEAVVLKHVCGVGDNGGN